MEDITASSVPASSEVLTKPGPTLSAVSSSKLPIIIGVAAVVILVGLGAFYALVYKPQQDNKNFITANDPKIAELASQINTLASKYPGFITELNTDLGADVGTESANLLGVSTSSATVKSQKVQIVIPQVLGEMAVVTQMRQLKVKTDEMTRLSTEGLVKLESVKSGLVTWSGPSAKLSTVNASLSKSEEFLKRSQAVSKFFGDSVQSDINMMPLLTNYLTVLGQFVQSTDKTVYLAQLNQVTADLDTITKNMNAIDTTNVPAELKEISATASQAYSRMVSDLKAVTPLLTAGKYVEANNILLSFQTEASNISSVITNREGSYWQNEPILKTGATVASNLTTAWEDFKSLDN